LIALLKYVQKNPTIPIAPKICSKEHYMDVRENRKAGGGKYSKEYTALIGYCASFGGKYYNGGFGQVRTGKRNIYYERVINLRKQAISLKNISFMSCDYNYFKDVKNCLLYLDPPYKGTSNYAKSCMNYDHFYKFCHDIAQNNFVIISEYDMPSEEFKCIWQKERTVCQDANRTNGQKATEKLFIPNL
jgi:DNA adenine methylase